MALIRQLKIIPLLLMALLVGCVTSEPPGPTPTSTATHREVVNAAVTIERQEPGRAAALGTGQSMAPIYGENTVIVTTPIDFDELEAGMIVAFFSEERGGRVIHQLTRKTRFGWRSKGLNNPVEDDGYVTAENLIGVVYGVFQSSGD